MRASAIILSTLVVVGCAGSKIKQFASENQRIDHFFEESFNVWVERSPEWQAYLGIKKNQNKLDNISEKRSLEDLEITKKQLKQLDNFDYSKLDSDHKLSYKIWRQRTQNAIDEFEYRFHGYPVNQMFGMQSEMPSFMINIHQVSSVSDVRNYISRLKLFKKKFDQLIVNLKANENLDCGHLMEPIFS